jgi:hypothetical protein
MLTLWEMILCKIILVSKAMDEEKWKMGQAGRIKLDALG